MDDRMLKKDRMPSSLCFNIVFDPVGRFVFDGSRGPAPSLNPDGSI
jgi:hypothetical protein